MVLNDRAPLVVFARRAAWSVRKGSDSGRGFSTKRRISLFGERAMGAVAMPLVHVPPPQRSAQKNRFSPDNLGGGLSGNVAAVCRSATLWVGPARRSRPMYGQCDGSQADPRWGGRMQDVGGACMRFAT